MSICNPSQGAVVPIWQYVVIALIGVYLSAVLPGHFALVLVIILLGLSFEQFVQHNFLLLNVIMEFTFAIASLCFLFTCLRARYLRCASLLGGFGIAGLLIAIGSAVALTL